MKCFRTYQHSENPNNLPIAWPSIVIDVGNNFQIPQDLPSHLPQDSNWQLMTDENYFAYIANHQSSYTAWYSAYSTATQTQLLINNAVKGAREFGISLLIEFASENVLLGITQAGMTNTVRKKLFQVADACMAGSLKDAITEIKAVPQADYDSTFITAQRLTFYMNKIEDYLGIARTTL